MKRRNAILAAMTLALLVPIAMHTAADEVPDRQRSQKKRGSPPSVVLTIDYGDGAQKRFPTVPWEQNMTVLDALAWAADHPHGIKPKHRGQGALAMVGQIDDMKNGGGNGKNWVFRVNDKLGDRSCGASRVSAGDEILWRFEVYR